MALEESGAAGDPVAKFYSGLIHLRGKVVERNETIAADRLRSAKEHRVALPQGSLAELVNSPAPQIERLSNPELAALLNRAMLAALTPSSPRGDGARDNARKFLIREIESSEEDVASTLQAGRVPSALRDADSKVKTLCAALAGLTPSEAKAFVVDLELRTHRTVGANSPPSNKHGERDVVLQETDEHILEQRDVLEGTKRERQLV